ncbi:hypothetical protein GA0070616_1596 [Micromonospora nigra]|uniref:Uncharacterized protein n=1 Tax=Micromonospora nigra TaxID=145857 RepID=A0A1C6RNQ4_9ACTN|nr:hypothetical protein [Micromonospora nigra]SCL18807.1 hypothetical protein GA0070616_1596 [Micromonospora nigra]
MSTFKPGDVLLIGEACSVQFAGDRALRLRLVSVDSYPTYDGWVWLAGYVLNDKDLATDKREVFVQRSGVRVLHAAPAPGRPIRPAAAPSVRHVRRPAGGPVTPQRRATSGRRTTDHG